MFYLNDERVEVAASFRTTVRECGNLIVKRSIVRSPRRSAPRDDITLWSFTANALQQCRCCEIGSPLGKKNDD